MDEYITPAEASAIIPRHPSPQVIWRWARKGIKKNGRVIRLRYVRIGRRICTKAIWLEDFFGRLADADAEPVPIQQPVHTHGIQLVDHHRADAELAAAGL